MISFRATGSDIGGQLELQLTEEPFAGITFFYERVRFADEENSDGTISLRFDYVITSEKKPRNAKHFESTIGDLLVQLMEEQTKTDSVIFHGGVGDAVIIDS